MENNLLTLDEMAVLTGKTGDESEMVYNQGYSLVRYIKDTYGYAKVTEINNTCGIFQFQSDNRKSAWDFRGRTVSELA